MYGSLCATCHSSVLFNNRGVRHNHELIKVQICLALYLNLLLYQGDHRCMDCLGLRPTGTQAQCGGYTFNFPDQPLWVTVIDWTCWVPQPTEENLPNEGKPAVVVLLLMVMIMASTYVVPVIETWSDYSYYSSETYHLFSLLADETAKHDGRLSLMGYNPLSVWSLWLTAVRWREYERLTIMIELNQSCNSANKNV
mgnify:CR=1 FL=1